MEKQLFERIEKEMAKQYDRLYRFEEKYPNRQIRGYKIALEYWDKFFEEYKDLVTDFVKMRKDLISSDRECVAFLFAVEKLGLWG